MSLRVFFHKTVLQMVVYGPNGPIEKSALSDDRADYV